MVKFVYTCKKLLETWSMKVKNEVTLDSDEMSAIRWMCGITLIKG